MTSENESLKTDKSNYVRYMSNPKAFTLKKWFVELLGHNYTQHDDIVERVATALTTESDLKQFGNLITAVFEKGYRKAIDDYKGQVEKLGLTITVGQEQSN